MGLFFILLLLLTSALAMYMFREKPTANADDDDLMD
jgi:hypothetical protein